MRYFRFGLIVAVLCLASCAKTVYVGSRISGATLVATHQVVRPVGQLVEYHGRPVDLVMSRDGATVYVKDTNKVLAIDAANWKIKQQLTLPEGGSSLHGLAISPDGKHLYVSNAQAKVFEATIEAGKLKWARTFLVEKTKAEKKFPYPCGIALSPDGTMMAVCVTSRDAVVLIDLFDGGKLAEIPVGVAPYACVFSPNAALLYVSDWGGRKPNAGEKTAKSADSDTLVDYRGIACSGVVSIVDVGGRQEIKEIETGLHPADVKLSRDGKKLYVANANSDTVSVIDTEAREVAKTINVRPDAKLAFGSISNALALDDENRKLYVANGGNNAVAVVDLSGEDRGDSGTEVPHGGGISQNREVEGFIPTGWFPGALAVDRGNLYIANVKGSGSRDPAAAGKWSSHSYWANVQKVQLPDDSTLAEYTQQAKEDALVPQSLAAFERSSSDVAPVPVPEKVGQPSVIQHVVYIIKENRSFDQILGDMKHGNVDPKLCMYGRNVTPNQHALADQFVLLDNFYCNGVLSADGHAWATQGLANDYLEKSFGAWSRSYPYPGDDAMAFSPAGFLWDSVLLHGLTFRNYGEFSVTRTTPIPTPWVEVYRDYVNHTGKVKFTNIMAIEPLRQYSCPKSPGWNLHIPDIMRADAFLEEFHEAENTGQFANLNVIYLPSDHTSGMNAGAPTPDAMIADNDLAVGRIVDAISHSRFWGTTCIFVIEDDPQAGVDHVDGHRSTCMVVSPYTRRGEVVSNFYNQTSVLRTIELMLGLEPMNQLDAMAPVMRECFMKTPDFGTYTALKSNVPWDKLNPGKEKLTGLMLQMQQISERQDLTQPDRVNDAEMNRVLWHAAKGADVRYPEEFAGAHGKGLKRLHLTLQSGVDDDD